MFVLVFITWACGGNGEVRKYKEKTPPPPAKAKTKDPHAGMNMPAPGGNTGTTAGQPAGKAHFHWDTPEGWAEVKKTSGIRLATFTVQAGEQNGECTIIPLSGDAGGLKANVSRWLGQMTTGASSSAPMMSSQGDPAVVDSLIKEQERFLTKGELPAVLIDYTAVTKSDADRSILAGVITLDTSTVFIKLNGPKALLTANKVKFKALCQSFILDTSSH